MVFFLYGRLQMLNSIQLYENNQLTIEKKIKFTVNRPPGKNYLNGIS